MRELERQLGRKTLEVEILKEALARSREKNDAARDVAAQGRFPVKAVAETLGVSCSNLIERLAGGAKPRRRYQKAQDAAVLPLMRRLVDARPTGLRLCGWTTRTAEFPHSGPSVKEDP